MKEILLLHTKSGDFNNKSEILEEIKMIKTQSSGYNFDVLVTYVVNIKGKNILVELQVPTLDAIKIGADNIEMVAYSFDGELNEYSADYEICSAIVNEDDFDYTKLVKGFAKYASEL